MSKTIRLNNHRGFVTGFKALNNKELPKKKKPADFYSTLRIPPVV